MIQILSSTILERFKEKKLKSLRMQLITNQTIRIKSKIKLILYRRGSTLESGNPHGTHPT